MTRLEKMQIEHNEALLSDAARQAVSGEVNRLQKTGLHMSLGSLPQSVLRVPAVQKRLIETRGLKVEAEEIKRGQNFETRLTTIPITRVVTAPKTTENAQAQETSSWCTLI